jgi:hypothetical protein
MKHDTEKENPQGTRMLSKNPKQEGSIRQGGQGPGQGRGANPGEIAERLAKWKSPEEQPKAHRRDDRATKSGRHKLPASLKRSKAH